MDGVVYSSMCLNALAAMSVMVFRFPCSRILMHLLTEVIFNELQNDNSAYISHGKRIHKRIYKNVLHVV